MEHVEVIVQADSTVGGRWSPVRGSESERAAQAVPDDGGRERVLAESAAVLSRCVPPGEQGTGTGLVVGYVQSGKTLSFTTVTAMARDNGFRLIIVIAGSSVPLFEQSGSRLASDLGPFNHWSAWSHYDSEMLSTSGSVRSAIRTQLEEWEDEEVPEEDHRAVLLTVMKNGAHLDRVTRLLREIGPILDSTPTLIIDDEADQASLNTRVNADEESATYRRIGEIRELLPRHTYLQYTATPQAPLLINIIDALSPDFAEVLTPGDAYTGGRTFFEGDRELVRVIPQHDILSSSNELRAPPSSLLSAMRIFFLGVAAGEIAARQQRRPSPTNRSMMVHPDRLTDVHQRFYRWVRAVKDRWADALAGRQTDRDRDAELNRFREAYDDLAETVGDLPSFDDLARQLPRSIRKTMVWEMNAREGRTPVPDWRNHYAHILVGGQALDRGFTVEGLTVAYMPRGLGVGNADTFQQRARWFGYKADYIGYCRVYLSMAGERAYRRYLEHEENVRESLRRHRQTGQPLREWKRAFILDRAFRPTRRAVLDLEYGRIRFGNRWLDMKAPHDVRDAVDDNRGTVDAFLGGLQLEPDEGRAERLDSHRHLVARDVPVRQVLSELLANLRFPSAADSPRFTALQLRLEEHVEAHPDATCTVLQMRPGVQTQRGTNDKGEIINLFAGAYPVESRAKVYPGDRGIKADEGITIQLHRLDVYDGIVSEGNVLREDVPVVAVWVPREMTQDWIVQQTNGGA
ncbi:MAG: Z1 domain-containing protein [Bacteroidota bacterium]